MAAPFILEMIPKVVNLRTIVSVRNALSPCQNSFSVLCQGQLRCGYAGTRIEHRSFRNALTSSQIMEQSIRGMALLTTTTTFNNHIAPSYCIVPSRSYGRKMIQKPPRFTTYDFSGDLRNLPELDKSTILYSCRQHENKLKGNETVQKLFTLEFQSSKVLANHRRELVRDRIVELFGPDSLLEQKIAELTLFIRQMIPHLIKYRQNKVAKILLIKCINQRRRLLTRLRSKDHERLEWLLKELKIRYVIPKDKEEYKGWKHNLRVSTQEEAIAKKRKKLEDLKVKFEEEKKVFYDHRKQVLAKMEEDLKQMGLGKDFLEQLVEQERKAKHDAIKKRDKELKKSSS